MALPLLGSSYFQQPNAPGIVTSKTADLMAAEGDELGKQIEADSYTTEAQQKAPAITDLYSSAYQQIAAGKFEGFADMQKARSMAIGNPILMKTMDEADMLAGHLANEYTTTQRAEDLAKFQLAKTASMQSDADARAAGRQQTSEENADTRQQTAIYQTQHEDWRKDNYAGTQQYAAQLKQYNKQMAVWQLQQKLGGTSPEPDKPEPFVPRPEPQPPVSKRSGPVNQSLPALTAPDLPDAGAAVTGDPNAEPLIPPSSPPDAYDPTTSSTDAALPSIALGGSPIPGMDDVPAPTAPLPSSFKTAPPGPDADQPFHQQVGNRTANGEPLHGLMFGYDPKIGGGLIVHINPPGPKLDDVELDVANGTAKEKMKDTHEEDKATEAISHFAKKDVFSKWAALQLRLGNLVDIRDPSGTEGKNSFYVAESNGQTLKDKNGQVVQMTKEDKDKWDEINYLSTKHVITYDHSEIPADHAAGLRDAMIQTAAGTPAGKFDYDAANNRLNRLNAPPISQDDVDAAITKQKADAAAVIQGKQDATKTAQAKADMVSMGFIDPPKIAGYDPDKTFSETSAEMKSLQSQLDSLKAKKDQAGSLSSSDLDAVQRLVTQLRDAKSKNETAQFYSGIRGANLMQR